MCKEIRQHRIKLGCFFNQSNFAEKCTNIFTFAQVLLVSFSFSWMFKIRSRRNFLLMSFEPSKSDLIDFLAILTEAIYPFKTFVNFLLFINSTCVLSLSMLKYNSNIFWCVLFRYISVPNIFQIRHSNSMFRIKWLFFKYKVCSS